MTSFVRFLFPEISDADFLSALPPDSRLALDTLHCLATRTITRSKSFKELGKR